MSSGTAVSIENAWRADDRVLIVDDSETVRQQVRLALALAGIGVIEACDGGEAVRHLEHDPRIRAVVCDVKMPRMSGIEMLTYLQEHGGVQLPVIMLTTFGDPSLIRRARALGAAAWIIKPFNAELLVRALTKLIRTAEQG